jgi:Zn-dependent membrane protease YugP
MFFSPFFLDPTYLLFMLPAMILVFIAQMWVKSTYSKWSKVPNRFGLTGAEAAQRLLNSSGLSNVTIEGSSGTLSDHYDPRDRTLHLSPAVARGQSVAAIAVAAHEIGHAIQDRQGYLPMRIRSAIVPAANIGSTLGWILILVGLMLQSFNLAWLGVLSFAMGAVFALATLPVELNASSRARALLQETGIISTGEEARGVHNVLQAAAFTYVAALATAILQLLYFVSLVGGMGGRRRS